VLTSRGAILNVYETGQFQIDTPQRPLIGSIQQAFYGGQSPWQYEALFVARAKNVVKASGLALSRELAEMVYDVGYYVHVDTPQGAVNLVTHMPYSGHLLTSDQLNAYAGPVVEQAVNQIVQLTPLEQVNEHIHEITELVRGHLQDFLAIYGIVLNDVKVLIRPPDHALHLLPRAMTDSVADRLRSLLASDVYNERGRLHSDRRDATGPAHQHGTNGLEIGDVAFRCECADGAVGRTSAHRGGRGRRAASGRSTAACGTPSAV
jgi:SPFH domain / Band 7 family